MALVDANYKFIWADVGTSGAQGTLSPAVAQTPVQVEWLLNVQDPTPIEITGWCIYAWQIWGQNVTYSLYFLRIFNFCWFFMSNFF